MEGFRNEPYTAAADRVSYVTLAAALVAAVPVNSMLKKYKWYEGFTYVLSLAGFALCVLSLAGGTYNPFIYFRF